MPFTAILSQKLNSLEEFPILHSVLNLGQIDEDFDYTIRYNSFELRSRRSKKVRIIDAPCPHLKAMQRALLDQLLAPIAPHDTAMAFVRGRSIAMNARRHHGASHLYTTDIKSFFPSIKASHVAEVANKRFPHLSQSTQQELIRLVTWNGQLPQGAPTSPHIANLVMFSFDELCKESAERLGATYTRYADDISVSANNSESLRHVERVIKMGLSALGMEMVHDKTRHLGPKQTKLVTGLDIGGTRIRPTRAFRKKTAALVRIYEKYHSQMERHRDLIRGYLAFWYDVDPIDPQLADLLERLGCSHWANKARFVTQDFANKQEAQIAKLGVAPEEIDFDSL